MAPRRKPLAVDDLTPGETLYIWRTRKGLDQEQAAETLGTSYRVYGKWERDESAAQSPKSVRVKARPSKLETCILLRRRAGMKQRELASKMLCSTGWIKVLESGRSDYEESLYDFWNV